MITVNDIVSDPDFAAPQPFTIERSIGAFVSGGFSSTLFPIPIVGPVQQASNKEIDMTRQADIVGAVRSFWTTQPVYLTRQDQSQDWPEAVLLTITGSGTNYVLSETASNLILYKNGLFLTPGIDYIVNGANVTLAVPTSTGDTLLAINNPETAVSGAVCASDIIVYESYNYRVLQTYYDPGSAYWKAYGTRMEAA